MVGGVSVSVDWSRVVMRILSWIGSNPQVHRRLVLGVGVVRQGQRPIGMTVDVGKVMTLVVIVGMTQTVNGVVLLLTMKAEAVGVEGVRGVGSMVVPIWGLGGG
jgi:hypothetical protein